MAALRPVVLDTNGHDKLLDDTDNLTLEFAPSVDNHGTNKKYVDDLVEAEATARQDADTVLQSNIDAEALARENTDTQLQENIDDEEAARIAADAALQSNIDNLDSQFQSQIDALDQDLQGQIDALDQDLQGQIDVIDGLYVRDTGDNMSGNLTLGTTKITLNASNGSGTFLGPLEAASIDGGSY